MHRGNVPSSLYLVSTQKWAHYPQSSLLRPRELRRRLQLDWDVVVLPRGLRRIWKSRYRAQAYLLVKYVFRLPQLGAEFPFHMLMIHLRWRVR